jgi:hypothetical protein
MQDLANIVVIRNHISFLMNSERQLVTKEMIKVVDTAKSKLDKLFIESIIKYSASGNLEVTSSQLRTDLIGGNMIRKEPAKDDEGVKNAKKNVVASGGIVTISPDQKQLELDFDKIVDPVNVDKIEKPKEAKKKASAKVVSPEEEAEIKAIQDKIAKAKAEVKAKAKKGGSFKRDNSEDDSEE